MKMYQAIDETVCIKEFGPELLLGWFATSKEALAAFRSEHQSEPEKSAEPRKPGRPKKAK